MQWSLAQIAEYSPSPKIAISAPDAQNNPILAKEGKDRGM